MLNVLLVFFKFIPRSSHGLNVVAVLSELAAKQLYLPVNSPVNAEIIISPYVVEYLVAGEHYPFIAYQQRENVELLRGKLDALAVYGDISSPPRSISIPIEQSLFDFSAGFTACRFTITFTRAISSFGENGFVM